MAERLLLATSWHHSAVADQFRALARTLHEAGVEVHWLDDRRHPDADPPDPWIAEIHQWPGTGRPGGLSAVRYADGLIRRLQPRTVIANFAAVTPLGLAARRAGVERRICWYHTVSEAIALDASAKRRVKQAVDVRGRKAAYRAYTDVVGVSAAAAADFTAVFGGAEGRGPAVHVRHNAVADGAHRTGPAAADAPVVAVGRLELWKGLDVLVRAAAQLAPARRIVILGEGAERDHLTRLAADLGVDLALPGTVAQGDVRGRMAEAAVLVVPSRAEAFGLVAAEGLAAGVPVVASEVGGLAEVVRPDQTGLLVPPDDPAALAAAIGRALEPQRNQVWGDAARQDFLARFEVETWAADLADRLLSGSPLGT
jgi:glycosyltransferase involved in cell wall biosynthesis